MEKRRLSLNRTGGAKNYNSPMKGGPYSAHPVHYKMIEDIHLDLDAMDNEIDKALNSTSTKVRQVAHSFTVLQSIYFDTDTGKWVLAQADGKDTIGTHVVVEVIDKDYFIAGLSGIFEVKNTLDLGYWFTSDTVEGELVETAPDINNPMIQVIDSNSIRVLDIGVVDNLDSIPASNVIVTNTVTPDFTPAVQGNNLQEVTNKVAGLQESRKLIYSLTTTVQIENLEILLDNEQRLMIEYSSNTGMDNTTVTSTFRINDVVTKNYLSASTRYNNFLFYTGRHKFAGTMELRNIGGLIFANCNAQQEWGKDNETFAIAGRAMQGFLELLQTGINKISIGGTFNAGLTINIYRI